MTEALNHRLRDLISDGMSPDDAASQAVSELSRQQASELLRPFVALRAQAIARERTRRIEKQVFAIGSDGVQRAQRDEIHRLARETFAVPTTGEVVTWLEATPEQHRARAEWLRGLASDIVLTALRHEEAADLIEAEGGACLADVAATVPVAA